MKIEELEQKLQDEQLLQIFDKEAWKEYWPYINYESYGKADTFGITKLESGRYAVYFTCDEKGGHAYYWATFDTMEEACDKLYWKVNLLNKIYKEVNGQANP